MTTISATSILSSRHALDWSKRIDTLVLRYPRCIHAEFMTHRVFSRNASSSRAIPVEKLIQDVLDDPFIPLHWGKNQKGMQANQETDAPVKVVRYLTGHGGISRQVHQAVNERAWLLARDQAVEMARAFSDAGYHKQIVNRLLEPFGHITVVVTSTQWTNFLALRDHEDAEPHIQILAREIKKALHACNVQILQPGQWHMPFVSHDEWKHGPGQEAAFAALDHAKKLSVARCASTSYKTVEGFDMTLERALAIYDKLYTMRPAHASPFEHQAQADHHSKTDGVEWENPGLGGNLGPGWIQLRKTLPDECL